MSWVRVDDKFLHHPKVIRAGLEAIGLWLMSCCWASTYETDGDLPADVFSSLPGYKKSLAQKLLEVGLWDKKDGGGFKIHDFLKYNPSAADLRAKRAATAERVDRHRLRSSGASNGVTDRVSNSVPRNVAPDPTRPDPTRPSHESVERSNHHNKKEEAQRRPRKAVSSGEAPKTPALPEWMPADLWRAWKDHRQRLRAPMTAYAEALALKKLAEMREQGQDPVELVNTAIERGWKGFWPAKGTGPGAASDLGDPDLRDHWEGR